MFKVEESTEKGKSIVALVPISKNDVITTFDGTPIEYKETIKLGDKESFALQVAADQYVYLNPPYRFFNHSCDPNCGLDPDLNLVAIKDIAASEELTYDYSTTMLEHHWQMKCECGSGLCRKTVKDFITLPADIQDYYLRLNVVQRFIAEHINNQQQR